MIERKDYYTENEMNAANSDNLLLPSSFVFPREGILVGDFVAPTGEIAPALIPIDQTNGLCFLSTYDNEREIKRVIQMMAVRLVCSIPPSKCKFVLYDGQGAGTELIQLAGLDPQIKGEAIITNPNEFKEKIKLINKSISKTIQNVLGAKYADKTLVDYNESVGEMAQPYTFIVIADFPQTLDKETIELIRLIIVNGRKAGVFVLMNLDTSFEMTKWSGFERAHDDMELLRSFLDMMTVIYQSKDRYYIKNLLPDNPLVGVINSFALKLDFSIPDNIDDVIYQINKNLENVKTAKLSIASLFLHENLWTESSSDGIDIPIGKLNGRNIQYFSLGKKHHHCLIGGRSGSGKSVLLHNIICNGSWLYSPDELQFILLDFKDGVEFNAYKKFPNVKILSVQSDTPFALNVFHFLDNQIKERAKLIKKLNVGNLKEYNQKAEKKLPRYVVIIDEFQRMFNSNYKTRGELESEIENLVRQGRSYGIHLVLCTQSLGDLTIKLAEFSLRIGLPFSSEKECRRICYDSTVPLDFEIGQALYCSNPNGKNAVQFRVSYIDRTEISRIQDSILEQNKKYLPFDRFLFDGESRADFSNIKKSKRAGEKAIYVGSPMSLKKEHSYYTFRREQGFNMLIVGQDVMSATSIVYHSVLQLLSTASEKDAIIICDKTSEDSPTFGKLSELSGSSICHFLYLKSDDDITTWLNAINEKVKERNTGVTKDYGEIYFVLFNTFNYLPARWKGELEPKESMRLAEILKDGSNYGIHLIAYSDTYKHYIETFRQKYPYEWGIKAAIKGGDSTQIFENEERIIKSEYESLFLKDIMREEQAEKIMVYEL